jgi:hypothetical protein
MSSSLARYKRTVAPLGARVSLIALIGCAAVSGCKTDEGAARPDPTPTTQTSAEALTDSPPPTAPPASPAADDAPRRGPVQTGNAMPAPGELRATLSGCLKEGSASDADGAQFPAAPEGTRSAAGAPADVKVSVMGDGVIISHVLDHACCLTAEVNVTTTADAVHVQEVLSGNPCRCRCRSTIQTSVGLALGDYTLTLETVQGGEAKPTHSQPIQVKPLRPRPQPQPDGGTP